MCFGVGIGWLGHAISGSVDVSIAKTALAIDLIRAAEGTHGINFLGERPERLVLEAEEMLGHTLPASYRLFVKELGHAGVGPDSIDGVSRGSSGGAEWFGVASRNLRNWCDGSLHESVFGFTDDGMGGELVLEWGSPDPCVSVWYPGHTEFGDPREVLAPDFGSWLLESVQGALENDIW